MKGPQRQALVALVATLAIQVFTSFAATAPAVLAPALAPDLGITPKWIGVFVSLVYAGAMLGSLGCAGFIARFGAIRVSQASVLLCAIGLAFVALLPGSAAPLLAGAAFLMGVGYGPITPASSEVLIRTTPKDRMGLTFSIKQTGVPAGAALAGAILPGVVGAIALVLVLYMAAILPINVTGLTLIGLAFALFVFDVFAPSHGVLTVGGIMAFLIGSLMLFDRDDPLFRLSLAYIIPATIITALFFAFVVGKGIRAQYLPIKAGKEMMLGKTVAAFTPIDAAGGKVFVEGEYWNAVSDTPVEQGKPVEISAVLGLTLKVRPKT